MCSMPVMRESTCSAGVVTSDSTSFADAPGNGISTFAMVTLICGSSSRGVTSTANTPSSSASSAISGVICECRKILLMRPEMPMVNSWFAVRDSLLGMMPGARLGRIAIGRPRCSRLALLAAALQGGQCSDRVERDLVPRRGAGEHLPSLRPCRFSQAQLAKADLAVTPRLIGAGHFAAHCYRRRRNKQLLHPADGEIGSREHARIQTLYAGRQVQPHLGRVGPGIRSGQDRN